MDINLLQNKTIIICNNDYKNKLLKEISNKKLFKDIKFYTKKAFLEEYYFSYDNNTMPYLINKYHLKIDILETYLTKLYYIEDKNYENEKLNFLKELKEDLIKNNLLIFNNNFKDYIQKYQIIVIDSYLNNWEEQLFSKLQSLIYKDKPLYNPHKVYEFNDIDSEIEFVLIKVIELINKGIDINNIKLMNVTKEYYHSLQRLSKIYNINIKIPTNNNLYSNKITHIFLNNLYLGIDKALLLIQDKDSNIVNKIINICNKYIAIKEIDILKELLIKEFKKTEINNFPYLNYLELINIDNYVNENDYVFLMNFNTSSIPSFIKDEDYFTDNIKKEINLEDSYVINKKIKEYTINKIKSIKNLIISYKLKDNKTIYYPSILIKDLELEKEYYNNTALVHYGELNDKLKLAKMLYNYETYGIIDKELVLLNSSIKDLNYNSFNNKYQKIDQNKLKEYLNNNLNLSYSHLNNYHKCAFRFYLANILKLKKDNDLFEGYIGSLLHDVLCKCIDTSKDSNVVIDEFIQTSKRDLNKKEEYFITILKEDIKKTLQIIKEQNADMQLDKVLKEQYIKINKKKDIDINFVGFIDKILYKELNNQTIVALIDYKTGNEDIDLKYKDYGFNLQLPVYLYLIKKSNLFKNPSFAGFYLQHILDKNISISSKSYEEELKERLKLDGYSNSETDILKYLDNNYANSHLIKGLKCKKDGNFHSNSKVLSNAEIDELINLVEKQIDEDIDKILNADFPINPKKIGYKNDIGCLYCQFRDICFKEEKDYVILEDVKGDNYATMD